MQMQRPRPVMDSSADAMDPAEWQTRVHLAAFYRIVAQLGWDDLIYSHVTARVPNEPDSILMNRAGTLFEEITASSLLKIRPDGTVAGDPDAQINEIGFRLHGTVFRAKPEAACVVHLHTPSGVAVSSQEGGLLPLSQPAMLLTGRIARHENEGLVFTPDEQERLARHLGDRKLMFLHNHGTLVWGESFGETFELTYNLERACDTQIRALAGGARPLLPPAGIPELTERQYASFGKATDDAPAWQAILRKLDRDDPSYRS